MRKYQWILYIALIGMAITTIACTYARDIIYTDPPEEMIETPEEPTTPLPPEMMPPEMMAAVDVVIYTFRSFWIVLGDAETAAETTKSHLEANGITVVVTNDDQFLREWMLETTGDGSVNVLITYGVIPSTVYGQVNSQPNGSIAENWIETMDGDTILNHADYFAFNSDQDVTEEIAGEQILQVTAVGSNGEIGLHNLMDNTNISLFPFGIGGGPNQYIPMVVTTDGSSLTPSLIEFESNRPFNLDQLQGDWYAEKIFASDTGDANAKYADPVIVRDGNLGRLAIIHATQQDHDLKPNGEVAAEMIINYLLADAPPVVSMPEPEPETPEMEAETPEMEPEMPTDTNPAIEGPVVSVSPAEIASAAVGAQLQVSINIAQGVNITGYDFTLAFDSTALRYVESSNADYLPGAIDIPVVVTEGNVLMGAASLSGPALASSGTLATITFEVIAAKASTLTLQKVELTDNESPPQTINPTTVDAEISAP